MPISKKNKYYDTKTKSGTNLYLTLPDKWKIILEYIVLNEKTKNNTKINQRDVATELIIKAMIAYVNADSKLHTKIKDLIQESSDV